MSLLWWRELGGDGAVFGAPAPGRGGNGIAGGGEGSDAADTLLRRLLPVLPELERVRSASRGSREARLDCLLSASCDCGHVSIYCIRISLESLLTSSTVIFAWAS